MECDEKIIESSADMQVINPPDLDALQEQETRTLSGRTPLWKRVFPFLTAGGILAYLFWHIDTRQCLAAFTQADISLYIPWLIVFIGASFIMDTQNLMETLRHFRYPISFRDTLSIRGVTYLLMTIDYSLGLGALVYYLKRNLSIPIMRSTGLMLYFNGITHFALVIMAVIGLLILTPSSPVLQHFLIFCISFILIDVGIVSILKMLPNRGLMLKIKNFNAIKVFHEAPWATYWALTFWRGIYYVLFIAFFYVAVRAFHMTIPLTTLIAYVPIILLIISLPIAPCGFGTAQAAMIYLFKGYGTSENIMAFGLTYSTSIILSRSLIGLFFANTINEVKQNFAKQEKS
ncbi:MAG TPA: lysylphosphatidylglycerol synthase domain-containing protein [Deltaproteobacteria bacterium]|jgi:uncharacterized membrane protein YbhN (UPF0104 family)|nr:lysylphosphatidylglycerol synthase domain-containing protein [Deltaproteobacteria bacterium]HOI08370.1 lysylphosphatidylglycerol synthase domain-containing protein [Deltaproteobacteria bacterium]